MSATSQLSNPYQPPSSVVESAPALEPPPYRSLQGQAHVLGFWLQVYAAFAVVLCVSVLQGHLDGVLGLLEAGGDQDKGPAELWLGGFGIVLFLVTTFLFARFLYRANQNARAFGIREVAFSPSSMIWWFFVPFANLLIPYRAVRNVFECSAVDPVGAPATPAYLKLWWILWIAMNFLDRMVSFSSVATPASRDLLSLLVVLGSSAGVAASLLARRMLFDLARRQDQTVRHLAAHSPR